MRTVRTATSEADIRRCFPVMRQLRARLTEDEFVERVRRQAEAFGYTLIFLEESGSVSAVGGFRVTENLCDGRYLYVDDLVTDESARLKGCAGMLFDWIVAHARERGCTEIDLDSGVQRFDAHRFYLGRGMKISSHHFSMGLKQA